MKNSKFTQVHTRQQPIRMPRFRGSLKCPPPPRAAPEEAFGIRMTVGGIFFDLVNVSNRNDNDFVANQRSDSVTGIIRSDTQHARVFTVHDEVTPTGDVITVQVLSPDCRAVIRRESLSCEITYIEYDWMMRRAASVVLLNRNF